MKTSSKSRQRLDKLGTLLLAFILAFIVWVVSVQQENPTETMTLTRIPVDIRDLPEEYALIDNGILLPPVDVQVRAPRSVLQSLSANDLVAYVDLSDAKPGRQEVSVQAEAVDVSGVNIVSVSPQAVVVRLEGKIDKSVPVIVNVIDSPPFGYIADTAIVTPTVVTVSGPESRVDPVQRAEVPVHLLDARSDVQLSEFVTLRDGNGDIVSGLEIEPRTVSVLVPIEQQQGFAEKSVLPRIEGQPAPNYVVTGVTADPATVTLVGDPATLDAMPPFVETIPIDIDGATEDIEELVPVIIPETVSVVAAQAVKVLIGVEPIEGSITLTLHPVVQGLGAGLHVDSISPETIDVILRGPLPRLQTLQADENVRAVLGLSNLEVGVYTITPILVLPEDVIAQTILPDTVQVTIIPKSEAETEAAPPAQ